VLRSTPDRARRDCECRLVMPRPAISRAETLHCVLIGAASGPADAIEALVLAQHTPREARSGAFGALTIANWLGCAVGSALAGVAIEGLALTAAVVIAATAALIAASSLVVPRWRRHLV